MIRYIKCPRCELNYIDAEKQEFCDVCIKEMKGIRTDADELEEDEAEELATELCPVCGENMMRPGEKMCDECRRKLELDEEEPDPNEDDDEWREYLDEDDDDMADEVMDIGETYDEEEPAEEEEEEEYHDDEEDLDYVTGDEIYTLSDDDDEDDDDDAEEDF